MALITDKGVIIFNIEFRETVRIYMIQDNLDVIGSTLLKSDDSIFYDELLIVS